MASISGTRVISKIVPFDTADTYATHDDQYGLGGLRAGVADATARNAIPTERRKAGMLVYQIDDGHYYKLENNLTTWTDKGTLDGGGGGSSGPYPTSNTVYVDATATPVAGKVFNTWTDADIYVQSQTPSISNIWCIEFAAGVYADNITIKPFVLIKGQGIEATVFSGQITGGCSFAELAAIFNTGIIECTIQNLIGEAGKILNLHACIIAGGILAAAIVTFTYCDFSGSFDASGGSQITVNSSNIYSATFGQTLTANTSVFWNVLGGNLTIKGGIYFKCTFKSLTAITDGYNYTFNDAFFSSTIAFPSITSGTWNFIKVTSDNEITINAAGGVNKFIDCTNIVITDTTKTLTQNFLKAIKQSFFRVEVPYSNLSNASTTITLTLLDILSGVRVKSVLVIPSNQFVSSGAMTQLTANVGTPSAPTKYFSTIDIFTAPSGTNFFDVASNEVLNININDSIQIEVNSVGANLDTLTSGQISVIITYEELF